MRRIITFLKDVRRELKKVQWPNRRELTTYTGVVIFSVVVVGVIIWAADLGYQNIITLILQ